MIELGELQIRDPSSVLEARKKIFGLARALQIEVITATQLATITSELARTLLQRSQESTILVQLLLTSDEQSLVLELPQDGAVGEAQLLPFFDQTEHNPARGRLRIYKRFSLDPQQLSNSFIERERERIRRPSRSELMEELRQKNEELKTYNARLEEQVEERTAELRHANRKMRTDLEAAARYVRTLLPAPTKDRIRTDWRYVPSADLGGDTFGYHWIDADHFCLYLIDVTGHGLDSSLLSVTVLNVLRSASLPNTDFRDPGQVLAALNEAFPMERYGQKMFTIWYGVYQRETSVLSWSGGGHPDPLLFLNGSPEPKLLRSQGPMMGMMPWPNFEVDSLRIEGEARLYVYSDGAHEIHKTDDTMWSFEEFVEFMSSPPEADDSHLDALLNYVRELNGSDQLADDFSIVEAKFSPSSLRQESGH